jgi:hypothetical protein
MSRTLARSAVSAVAVVIPVSCEQGPAGAQPPTAPIAPLASELVFYEWPEDMPQSALDAFEGSLASAGVYLTLTPEGDETYAEMWSEFLAAAGQ